jgi:NADH:ubiquinone oxidoreductase subunit
VGLDRYGNSYYENAAELPLRTRWVDYKDHFWLPDQIEPGWHAWMSYLTDTPPSKDAIQKAGVREWEPKQHLPVQTLGWGNYRPYSTTGPKVKGWTAVAKKR